MEKERHRASAMGYPDPVNDTYEDTGKMYDDVIKHFIQTLIASSGKQHHLVVASHNQQSLFNAIKVMKDNGIPKDTEQIVFGQIFGMGEQISMPLGEQTNESNAWC